MRGTESPDEKWDLRHGKLQDETDDTCCHHQQIIPGAHGKYGLLYITHADGMIQLAHSQHSKCIGLRFRQYLFPGHQFPEAFYPGKRIAHKLPFRRQDPAGKHQKCRQSDHGDQCSIEQRTCYSSSGKQALRCFSGRAAHQAFTVIFIHSQRQCRKGIRDQIDPKDMAGF